MVHHPTGCVQALSFSGLFWALYCGDLSDVTMARTYRSSGAIVYVAEVPSTFKNVSPICSEYVNPFRTGSLSSAGISNGPLFVSKPFFVPTNRMTYRWHGPRFFLPKAAGDVSCHRCQQRLRIIADFPLVFFGDEFQEYLLNDVFRIAWIRSATQRNSFDEIVLLNEQTGNVSAGEFHRFGTKRNLAVSNTLPDESRKNDKKNSSTTNFGNLTMTASICVRRRGSTASYVPLPLCSERPSRLDGGKCQKIFRFFRGHPWYSARLVDGDQVRRPSEQPLPLL